MISDETNYWCTCRILTTTTERKNPNLNQIDSDSNNIYLLHNSDSYNIYLLHKLKDKNKKRLFLKFQLIPILLYKLCMI